MALIKWSPMADIDDFDKFFDDFLPRSMMHGLKNYFPAIDVYQDENRVTVEAELPGIDPDKVNVSVENDILTIEGKHEKQTEVEEKNYYRKEISLGSFHRVVPLPAAVNGVKAEASYEGGILKVIIPKEERARSKKILIKTK